MNCARVAVPVVLVLLLAGCGSSGGDTAPAGNPHPPATVQDRYSLANGCYAMSPKGTQSYLARTGQGGYVADAAGSAAASGFYMKPAALGQYMVYADDQSLVSDVNGHVGRVDAPRDQTGWAVSEAVIWTVQGNSNTGFTLVSAADDGQALAVDGDGNLVLKPAAQAQAFSFEPVDMAHCAEFPEIHTQTEGATFKGKGVNKPVVGIVDAHMHLSATGFLGGDHVGRPFSKYGVTDALPNGSYVHGPDGHLDLIGNLYGGKPTAAHDTQGWPTFKDWPGWDMLTHESTYYKWVKRYYKAGLRLMVNNLVQNDALCQLESAVKIANNLQPDQIQNLPQGIRDALDGILGAGVLGNGVVGDRCDGMKTAQRQIEFMHALENYIDAQNGGPGKGWFRLVDSPEQARKVINAGKLAVVLGIEISNVFDCHVQIVDIPLAGTQDVLPGCNKQQIDDQMTQLYNEGVRHIYLVHEFNNALGGNGIFNGGIINVGNFADTKSFWRTHDCPTSDPTGDYKDYYYTPGAILTSVNPLSQLPDNPLSGVTGSLGDLINTLTQGVLPSYPTNVRQCNDRGITDLGRYAVKDAMKHHMLIDVDHESVKMKSQVIAIAQQYDYPVTSSHGGHGGISMEQARDIVELGGYIYPIDCTPQGYIDRLHEYEKILPAGHIVAMGCSSDINGMAAQPAPSDTDVPYPFTLFEGPAFSGPMFKGIKPVTFSESAVPEGNRDFDFNQEGVAEYGLYADFIKALAMKGGAEAIEAYYRSAEGYLEAWEKADRQRDIQLN